MHFKHWIAFFVLGTTACGSNSVEVLDKEPSLTEYNKACLEGKISGSYLVKFKNNRVDAFSASSIEDLKAKLIKLNLDTEVIDVDFNYQLLASDTVADSTPSRNKTPTEILNAHKLWSLGISGNGIKVALIDTGLDINHKLFEDQVLINEAELGNDEDQNGFVNDKFGWDFIENKPLTKDRGFHGTAVGSVIASKHLSSIKISMAPLAKLIPIVGIPAIDEDPDELKASSRNALLAMRYAVKRGAQIINASWGGENCSRFLRDEITKTVNSGIFFVTAAGNESTNLDTIPRFPASFLNALTVGSLNNSFEVSEISNFGAAVDFFTLGENIFVAAPQNKVKSASGTSISTSFISGALALLKEAFPNSKNEDLTRALKDSATPKRMPDLEKAYLLLSGE